MFTKRTDLAIEAHELWQESAGKTTRLAGVKATEKKIQGYPVTQVDILDREGEAALGKPAGSYRTLDLTAFWQRGDGFFDRAVRAVGQQVKELTPDSGPVLVVGLGNRAMTPDAVGPLAADSVLITRHLIDAMPQHFSGFRPVAALRPGVLGTTGVESAEAVRGLVDRLHPSAVIGRGCAGLPPGGAGVLYRPVQRHRHHPRQRRRQSPLRPEPGNSGGTGAGRGRSHGGGRRHVSSGSIGRIRASGAGYGNAAEPP